MYVQEGQKDSEATPMNPADLLKAFQQFMEQSNIGEFEMRLQLLFSFHCQLVNMDRTTEQGESSWILIQYCIVDLFLNDFYLFYHISVMLDSMYLIFYLSEIVMHMLWNVYQYYNQFGHLVSNQIKKIRDPVEKDLKVGLH